MRFGVGVYWASLQNTTTVDLQHWNIQYLEQSVIQRIK